MLFNNPIGSEKADRVIRLLGLPSGGRVLDAGCGRGEFLIRTLEKWHAKGLGIDRDEDCIQDAKREAAARLEGGRWEFRCADVQTESLPQEEWDLAVCIGSTHAFAAGERSYPACIEKLSALLKPGGRLLVGDGYWKRPPAPEYLDLIGEPVGIYRSHEENIRFAKDQGLVPLYATVSNPDEWDHFEWTHRMRIEEQADRYPDDPDVQAKLLRSRQWLDGYLRWGRETMGFGLYLYGKL